MVIPKLRFPRAGGFRSRSGRSFIFNISFEVKLFVWKRRCCDRRATRRGRRRNTLMARRRNEVVRIALNISGCSCRCSASRRHWLQHCSPCGTPPGHLNSIRSDEVYRNRIVPCRSHSPWRDLLRVAAAICQRFKFFAVLSSACATCHATVRWRALQRDAIHSGSSRRQDGRTDLGQLITSAVRVGLGVGRRGKMRIGGGRHAGKGVG